MSGENLSYTTEEVAKLLKVSKLTVYHLIKKGMLPAYRIGRQMRIEAKDLEAFKERRKNEGGKGREREEFPIPKEKGNDEDKEGVQMERDSSRDHRKAFRLHADFFDVFRDKQVRTLLSFFYPSAAFQVALANFDSSRIYPRISLLYSLNRCEVTSLGRGR